MDINKSVLFFQGSQDVYSFVRLKNEDNKKVDASLPIIYNPPNVKKLNKLLHLDETGFEDPLEQQIQDAKQKINDLNSKGRSVILRKEQIEKDHNILKVKCMWTF